VTTTTPGEPYWLIREPGKTVGFGTVEFDGDTDPEAAIARFWQKMEQDDPKMREYLFAVQAEAELVTLTYINGDPVVSPVAI
jgi:hypothetical protein